MIKHVFYQDPVPREIGRCDFTFPDGDYCGALETEHDSEWAHKPGCSMHMGRPGRECTCGIIIAAQMRKERDNARGSRDAYKREYILVCAERDKIQKALRRAHSCATLRDDGTCDGCFVSEALAPVIANLPCGCHPRGDGCNICNHTTPAPATPLSVEKVEQGREILSRLKARTNLDEAERDALRDDVKRWQKKASDIVAELDASEKMVKETRIALLHLWEWATTVACRSGIGDRYLNEAKRILSG